VKEPKEGPVAEGEGGVSFEKNISTLDAVADGGRSLPGGVMRNSIFEK
jgi:hypothetical protein